MKNTSSILAFALLLACQTMPAGAQIINTIAGNGSAAYGGDGGPAVAGKLFGPIGVAVDAGGNIYIGDRDNNRIRKVGAAGIITTIAGTGVDGYSGDNAAATDAKISLPYGVAVDASGNVYFCDEGNHRVRKISASGIITTIAGTGTGGYNGDGIQATAADVNYPTCVAVDGSGNLYFTDYSNNRIRRINNSGIISTIGGNGNPGYTGDGAAATLAKLYTPYGIAADGTGNVYFGQDNTPCVRKISAAGIISTIAGTGTAGYSGDNIAATVAQLRRPVGVCVDHAGNILIAEYGNGVVRKVNAAGIITSVAGTGIPGFSGDGGIATAAQLGGPIGITTDAAGNIYMSDFPMNRIRYIRNTVAVQDINDITRELVTYPNPNSGDFVVKIAASIDEPIKIVITDIAGRKITELKDKTNSIIEVSLSAPPGMYFLTATTDTEKMCKKILVR